MSKRQPDPDSSQQAPKKHKTNSVFRFAVPRVTPTTVNERSSTSSSASIVSRSTITTLSKSEDGRRRGSEKYRNRQERPSTPQRPSTPPKDQYAHPVVGAHPIGEPEDFSSTFTPEQDGFQNTTETSKSKRQRNNNTSEWLSRRQMFLDELLRHDGRGDSLNQSSCFVCKKRDGIIYKCEDCTDGALLKCRSCTVLDHCSQPFHRIKWWNGQFFDKTSLQSLGLRVQLGHSGGFCPCPEPGPQQFTVFALTGIHQINIDYCGCQVLPLSKTVQILRQGWFPATFTRPQTAFTFDCLSFFHELTLQGKVNLYDFYHTLLRVTDNANLSKTIYRYTEFHRVFRLWRNLMALKRAGRGQDPLGVEGTAQGELAVECPACPHPGRNLPDNWREAGNMLFLYILYIAVDANFKLKGKNRGLKDVELMPGWAYFVREDEFQAHIANHVDEPEINSCESEHDAIVRAGYRSTPGYAVSGAGLALCSRHVLVRKNGVADLNLGEKYCYMDYLIFSAILLIILPWIVITYDIGCQWSKNMRKRVEGFPEAMRINPDTRVDVGIPSWHINAHGKNCRDNFSLGYLVGAGRTCGEEVETSWSHTNALAPSVREMGPAARHETLNDHWSGWNFHKIVGFRTFFLKRFQTAFVMSKRHQGIADQLSKTFSPETIKKWEEMVKMWDRDKTAPNPYAEPQCMTTLQDVRLELAKEEAVNASRGVLPKHKITLTGFFFAAFDIEEQQYLLGRTPSSSSSKNKTKTSKQKADIEDKRTSLLKTIQNWREVQLAYMPHAASFIASTPVPGEAENVRLYLPSSLPPHIRNQAELRDICDKERRLREAQADDALAHIRRLRRVIQGMWQFKKFSISGTGNRPNTRMLSTYHSLANNIQKYAHVYRSAYAALQVLDPSGKWSHRLRPLLDRDISGPGKDPEDPTQNSRYEPSWIWLVVHNPSSEFEVLEEDFNDSMRVEWAKVMARAARWNEELLIVLEEIRRVVMFLSWKSSWWVDRAVIRNVDDDPALVDGIQAYAYKQAAIQSRMRDRCASHWLPVLEQHGITPSWKDDLGDDVGISMMQDKVIGQGQQLEDYDDDRESENESDLDDEEDIINNFAFED